MSKNQISKVLTNVKGIELNDMGIAYQISEAKDFFTHNHLGEIHMEECRSPIRPNIPP